MDKYYILISGQTMNKILGAALLLTAVYYMTMYNDGTSNRATLAAVSEQLQAEEVKKEETDQALKQVQEMKDKIGTLSSKYEEISKRLPEALYSIDLNKGIDVFARQSKVVVINKRPGENKVGEVIEEVPVEVVIEGTYGQIATFAYQIASAQRMSRLRDIVVTVVPTDDPNNTKTTKATEVKLKLEGRVVGYKLAPVVQPNPDAANQQGAP